MERVALVGGVRTPFVRAGGVFAQKSFIDLQLHCVEALLKQYKLDPAWIEEAVLSTVLLDARAPNAAREVVLRSSLLKSTPAHFLSNNCISGLVAINAVAESIKLGRLNCGLAGGSESMSRPALSFHPKAEQFFLKLSRARSLTERLSVLSSFKLKYCMPLPPSPKEPSTGLTMGEHCELSAKEFSISREDQDAWAFRSHRQASLAAKSGILKQEIAALDGVEGDNIIRADTTLEKLSKLRPVFDRSAQGTLTAGNSSSLTDGASAVCLMSESEARKRGLKIMAFVESVEYSALAPSDGLLMAPGLCLPRLLTRAGLSIDQIDRFEIHEAFAAQVLANRTIWEKGWSRFPELKPIGAIPDEKINVHGGSIALGHPFAATGGRILVSLANELQRANLQRGVISVCAAGGMACAMLVSRGD